MRPAPPAPPNAAPPHLRLRTLGDAALLVVRPDGTADRLLGPGKPFALVVYLALAAGGSEGRARLAELLWSTAERDAARASLRVALHELRSRLGEDAFDARTDLVTLAAPVESDHHALLTAWERHDAEQVVAHYAGDFLPDLALPGGAGFNDWADLERLRLRLVFARAGERVVRARLAAGRTRDAIALARRVRDLDRLAQGGWRLLIEALVAGHDAIGAMVEAEALRRLLDEEELDPEPATRDVLRELPAAAAGSSGDPSPDDAARPTPLVELVGREREFSAILGAWEQARAARVTHVRVVAPAGLGKSRLLAELAARLRSMRGRVVHVAARHGTRDIPYATASDVAARLGNLRGASAISPQAASALVALNPSLSAAFHAAADPAVGEEALRRRALAVRELVAMLTEDRPLALLLDDLHWADAHSLRLLDTVLVPLEGTRLLVVTATRPPGDALRPTARETPLPLQPLATDAIAALLASIAPIPSAPWAERLPDALRDATGGSPLLVLETLRLLRERGLLVPDERGWLASDADALLVTLGEGSVLAHRLAALDPAERAALLALAIAGGPLAETTLRTALGDDVVSALVALDRRGLVSRRGAEWTTAHDEHARAALDLASADEVRATATVLGRAVALGAAREGRDDDRRLRLAALLLVLGDDRPTLERVFRRFVRAARREGDLRSNRALAHALLGTSASAEVTRALLRTLPWHVRTRFDTPPRIATAATLALIALGAAGATALARRDDPTPLAMLLAVRPVAGQPSSDLYEVPVLPTARAGETIDVDLRRRPDSRVPGTTLDHPGQSNPDGRGWVVSRETGDSGTIDVYAMGFDGRLRRLTAARGDDIGGSWSPDGGRFVFETSRRSREHHRLALFEARTGATAPLGPDVGDATFPAWSPDGSRIAFVLRGATGATVCVIDVDGTGFRCPMSGRAVTEYGWVDARRLLVRRGDSDSASLGWMDIDSGREETLGLTESGETPVVSPDGSWLVCNCVRRGRRGHTRTVVRLDGSGDVRTIRLAAGDTAPVTFTWSPRSPRAPWVSRVEVDHGPGMPVVGVSHRLRVVARDTSGRPTAPGVIRWRSLDSAVASVDSAGLLQPRRAGRVRVVASAGGWRADTVELLVREPATRLLLDEQWTQGLATRWRPYGRPTPAIVRDARFGLAFHNRGDTDYFSGAYTTAAFDTREGLWVDAELSMPLVRGQPWQEQLVALHTIVDSARLARWDHATGDFPAGIGTMCRLHLPFERHTDSLLIDHPERGAVLPMPARVGTGRPFRATIQVFPDGRCGYAIDGIALWVGEPAFDGRPAHVRLEGRSVGIRNLVGRVRVYVGVTPQVASWALDSTFSRRE